MEIISEIIAEAWVAGVVIGRCLNDMFWFYVFFSIKKINFAL